MLGEKFELKGPGIIWWSLPTFPVRPVSRIYFVWDGAVRAWRKVLGFDYEQDAGFIEKRAVQIERKHHVVDPPVPMKGFQGYRYYIP